MSNVTQLPAERPSPMMAGGAVKPIIPQSMEDAYRLAKAISMSGLAPKGMDKPETIMIAIMQGMEVGLTPLMALQKIAVINGRPTIWGDGALGLVRASGLCEYVEEAIEGEGDKRVAVCLAKRKGEPKPIRRTFSVGDAKLAGLWGKQGPWQQFANRMLQMRARAFALRDGFADVLGGMYLAEELQGTEMRDITPVVPSPPPAPSPAPAKAIEAPKEPAPEVQPDTTKSYDERIADWEQRLKAADFDTQAEIWSCEVEPYHETQPMFPPDFERLRALIKEA